MTTTDPFNPILCLLAERQADPGVPFVPKEWKEEVKGSEDAGSAIPEGRTVFSPNYR